MITSVTSDNLNPFVYCSKTRPSIGKASSASQPPNSRQNDINLQTAADFFAARCAKGKFCDGFLNQQKQGLRSCKSQLQNERPSPQKPIPEIDEDDRQQHSGRD